MTLDALLPDIPQDLAGIEIAGLTADSRKVQPGYLFAALKGAQTDGHRFVGQAVANGAAIILSENEVDTSVPNIIRPDARRALAFAASTFFGAQPDKVAAVTGTNGKSSTVDFLRQIWSALGLKAASMGTLGAIGPRGAIDLGHTTPDPVAIHSTLRELTAQGVTHLAMEASSHGLEQSRLDGVKLSAVAFTNLTQDHLDYHPTFEDYRRAKQRLFSELAPQGAPALINADSPERGAFDAVAQSAGLMIRSVGWRGEWLKLRELSPRPTGQSLDLLFEGNEVDVELPLIGEFQALNALMAAGLAIALGAAPSDTFAALRSLRPVKGRMELVGQTANGATVFVDYAHTPDGLETLLRAARPHTAGDLVCVFGCGGNRDADKRPKMGRIAAKFADLVIVTDDNPRHEAASDIRAAILSDCPRGIEIADRGQAISDAIRRLKSGDTLVIAGKGHETGQIVGDQVLLFSDQDHADKELRQTA